MKRVGTQRCVENGLHQYRCAIHDAMFARHVPKARIMSEASSLPQATSFARRANIIQKRVICLPNHAFLL
jgi:hypothetical protein